ncbi:MAG: archaellin/type IV pilin N-terminal domain-containing protein [archaeon]
MNDKGLAPVFAVLLLVMIALVLSGILLTWGNDLFRTKTQFIDEGTENQVDCLQAELEILDCNFMQGPGAYLTFKLNNSGSVDFDKNFVIIVDDTNVFLGTGSQVIADYNEVVKAGHIHLFRSYYSAFARITDVNLPDLGVITRLKVIPVNCPQRGEELTSC